MMGGSAPAGDPSGDKTRLRSAGIYRCRIFDMAESNTCALCHNEAKLRQSHIVPSFFGAYLKETSATGYLRGAVMPNLRIQDLSKEELLCDSCEGRFAVWEKSYKERAFPTVQDDAFTQLEYGPWLLSFLVSLSWRVLVTQRVDLAGDYPQFSGVVERTLENWRLFLLGDRKQPGSEHHLFIFADIPETMPADLHEKILHYMLRAVDATTGANRRILFVYIKALRSLVFSPILPASPSGWANTRVHVGQGKLVSPQKIAMSGFGDFLNSQAEEAFAQSLSDNQKAKIGEVMMRDPERALTSESYKVHQASKLLIRSRKK
jgi:hypothetical protein